MGAQEKAIGNRLDITKLQDPKFVASFTDRYLLAANSTATTNSAASLEQLAVSARGLLV